MPSNDEVDITIERSSRNRSKRNSGSAIIVQRILVMIVVLWLAAKLSPVVSNTFIGLLALFAAPAFATLLLMIPWASQPPNSKQGKSQPFRTLATLAIFVAVLIATFWSISFR